MALLLSAVIITVSAKLIQMSNKILNLIFAVKTVKYLSFQSVPIHIEIYAKRQNNQLPHLCWHCVNSQLYNKYNLKTQSTISYCFPSFFHWLWQLTIVCSICSLKGPSTKLPFMKIDKLYSLCQYLQLCVSLVSILIFN